MKRGVFIFLLIAVLSTFVSAHEDGIGKYVTDTSLNMIYIASMLVLFFVFISLCHKENSERMKWLLFLGIAIPVVFATIFSAGNTIYLNVISETKGPVHWHADFEIWNCNEKIDLVDPEGMINRVGSSVFHEHGDDRIHVEGVVVDKRDVNLKEFFETVGAELDGHLKLLTNEGSIEIEDGKLCNGEIGKLQTFVYRNVQDELYEQVKINNIEEYVLSPYPLVPPGDCIIIEFDKEKDRTNKICKTYEIALKNGEIKIGS